MGAIKFLYRNPDATGVDEATRGHVEVRLFQREIADGSFRTVEEFEVPLVPTPFDADGEEITDDSEPAFWAGYAVAELSDTGVNQAWFVREKAGIAGADKFYKQVSGDANFVDLPDVDPSTLAPLNPLPPSAQEILSEAAAARDDAQGYAQDALVSADDAEGFRDEAETFAQGADDARVAAEAAAVQAPIDAAAAATAVLANKADKSTQDTVETGRLSVASLNSTIATQREAMRPTQRTRAITRVFVTTAGVQVRLTERHSTCLEVTNDTGQAVSVALGPLDSGTAPSSGEYTSIPNGSTWRTGRPNPVWLKAASSSVSPIIYSEVLS